MGKIHLPPLRLLAEALTSACGLVEFVETGTDQGDALPWATSRFERVTTIEILEDSFRSAVARYGNLPNLRMIRGDSAAVLADILPDLAGPSLFWLDAHAGAGFFGTEDRCPLLVELSMIAATPLQHCILVDDARAFLAPPPPPFDYRIWPTLDEVLAVVARKPGYHVVVIEDAMVIVPRSARGIVAEFCRRVRPAI